MAGKLSTCIGPCMYGCDCRASNFTQNVYMFCFRCCMRVDRNIPSLRISSLVFVVSCIILGVCDEPIIALSCNYNTYKCLLLLFTCELVDVFRCANTRCILVPCVWLSLELHLKNIELFVSGVDMWVNRGIPLRQYSIHTCLSCPVVSQFLCLSPAVQHPRSTLQLMNTDRCG